MDKHEDDEVQKQLSKLDGSWEDKKSSTPKVKGQQWWEVQSHNDPRMRYDVTNGETEHCVGPCCNCPHHMHRYVVCKHIRNCIHDR